MRGSVILLSLSVIVIALILDVDAGRRGGGGSRRGGSSGGVFGGLFGGKKSKPSSSSGSSYPKQTWSNTGGAGAGSSYPKQTWSNTGGAGSAGSGYPKQTWSGGNTNTGKTGGTQGGVGGGGWVNPKGNTGGGYGGSSGGGWVNPSTGGASGFGRSGGGGWGNSYKHNYYGNNYYSSPKSGSSGGLFGGGKKSFALGAGAGFLGGAMVGMAGMSVYHRYLMYQNLMHGGYGGYGGYGGGYGHGFGGHSGQCFGGCPIGAYCDFGICRCRPGTDAFYGECHSDFGSEYNSRRDYYDRRRSSAFDPYGGCNTNQECWKVDMNMICNSTRAKCHCRENMKWNDEVGECQVFMDVDCTGVTDAPRNKRQTEGAEPSLVDTNSTVTDTNSTDIDPLVANVTVVDPAVILEKNVTLNESLAGSALLNLDVNKTSKEEIKATFCKEIGAVAQKFQLADNYQQVNRQVNRRPVDVETGAAVGTTAIIVILVMLCCCCCCVFAICKFFKTTIESFFGKKSDNQDDDIGMQGSDGQQPFSAPFGDGGVPPPYSANDNNMPYPPTSGAPYNDNNAPYPPTSGAPYPPSSGAPYPPAGGESAPYPPAGGAYPTPYPPQPYPPPGNDAPYPPYPPQQGYNSAAPPYPPNA